MPHWRAIQTVPQREWYAQRALHRLAVPTFLPQYSVRRHRKGSPWVVRPLFPSYIFANLDGVAFGKIRRCRWVMGILGTIPISTPVMDAIRKACENVCVSPRLRPGHSYRLNRKGALGELLVRLERLDDHGKAVVLLEMFGVERVITVEADDLTEQ